jgi:hypothetical protein
MRKESVSSKRKTRIKFVSWLFVHHSPAFGKLSNTAKVKAKARGQPLSEQFLLFNTDTLPANSYRGQKICGIALFIRLVIAVTTSKLGGLQNI